MPKSNRITVFEISLLYLIGGLVWVLFNDYLEVSFGNSAHIFSKISAILFVILSSFLFYFFLEKFIKTRKDLTETKTNLDAIISNTKELVILVDKNLKIISFNKLFENYVSAYYNRLPKVGESYSEIVSPNNVEVFNQRIQQVLSGESINFERKIELPKMPIIWLNVNYKPIINENNKIDLFVVTILDITSQKKAEIAIESAKIKFEAVFNDSNSAILITRLQTLEILDCNEKSFETFNIFSKSEIINKKPYQIFKVINDSQFNTELQELQIDYNGQIDNELEIIILNNQRKIWVHLNAKNIHVLDEDLMIIWINDITNKKNAELKLIEEQKLISRITELAPDIIYLNDRMEKKDIFSNRNLIQMLGYDVNSFPELSEDLFKKLVHPEDYEKVKFSEELMQRMMQNKYVNLQYRLLSADGNWRWFETIDTVFETNNDHTPSKILGYVREITDSKKAQQVIEEEQKFSSGIISTSPVLICTFDLINKSITFSNEQVKNAIGYSSAEIIAMGSDFVQKLIHPDDIPILLNQIEIIKDKPDEEIVNFQLRAFNKSKSTIWFLVNAKVFKRNEIGLPTTALATLLDISELKNYEEMLLQINSELKVTNEELDSFVYRASHDLRSPLASVLGLINLLSAEAKSVNESHYLELMKKSINKLMEVIEDLINHSKNARLDLIREKIDLNVLVWEIINDLRYMDNAKKIHFDVECDITSDFYSDRMRLLLAFNNLISNSIKYHDLKKEKPYIYVKIKIDHLNAYIRIEDNGLGIETKHQDKIFDMFYRATKTSNGSGLGLYIVKGIMDKLKGRIKLQSEFTIGSVFEISIPNLINQHKFAYQEA
ncbi:MAG: PAS domain S-box protein [Bacteroidota bacterium]|nr:PAS domain S-box protein [Bacteroidota bacterium]